MLGVSMRYKFVSIILLAIIILQILPIVALADTTREQQQKIFEEPVYIDKAILSREELLKYASDGYVGLIVKYDPSIFGATTGNAGVLSNNVRVSAENYVVNLASTAGAKVKEVKSYKILPFIYVKVKVGDVGKLVKELTNARGVEEIWLDRIVTVKTDTGVPIIGAPYVWYNLGYDGSGVKIAIIDTGVDVNHPDLAGKVIATVDFTGEGYYDGHGHGTHVASIAAGLGVAELFAHSGTHVWRTALSYVETGRATSGFTYEFNVTSTGLVNLSFWAKFYTGAQAGYEDMFQVLYSFDGATWNILLNATGQNPDWPNWTYYVFPIDTTNQTALWIRFQYNQSYGPMFGIWVDDIRVDPIGFFDDIEGPVPPQLVSVDPGWMRVEGKFHGVAPGAQIMAAKALTSEGWGYWSWIMAAIEWAALGPDYTPNTGDEADVISMSLGGLVEGYDPVAQLVDAVVSNYGIAVVVAAGNEGPDYFTVETPGIARNAITVGATVKSWNGIPDRVAFFSSRGPSPVDYSVKPNVLAPGLFIIAARANGTSMGMVLDQYYTLASGTSMATPFVSGAVALIRQAHPDWDPFTIRAALESTATPIYLAENLYTVIYEPANPFTSGAGLINVSAAIQAKVIPYPAIVSYGVVYNGSTYTSVVVFRNQGTAAYQVNITNTSAWLSTNVTSFVIPPNGSVAVEVVLSVPGNATAGPDGGYVFYVYNATGTNMGHITVGYYVTYPVTLTGRVVDAVSGLPVAGMNVSIVLEQEMLSYLYGYTSNYSILASTTTDVNGTYSLIAPANITFYIMGNAPGYYVYLSLPLYINNTTIYDFKATPIFGYHPLQVLVVADNDDGYVTGGVDATVLRVLALNGTNGIIMRLWNKSEQGLPYFAILTGDFPAIFWSASTVFSGGLPAAINREDAEALYQFLIYSMGGYLVEGEDVGYDWWYYSPVYYIILLRSLWATDDTGTGNITIVRPTHPLAENLPTLVELVAVPPFPDGVYPVLGGLDLANYTYNATNISNYTAIVFYNGSMYFNPMVDQTVYPESKIVYITYPMIYMNNTDFNILTMNALMWLLDRTPPGKIPDINASINLTGGNYTITLTWPALIDPPFNLTVTKYIVNVSYTATLNATPSHMFIAMVNGNTYSFTVQSSGYYLVSIRGIDKYDNIGKSVTLVLYIPPPLVTAGGSFFALRPGIYTYSLPDINVESLTFNVTASGGTSVSISLYPREVFTVKGNLKTIKAYDFYVYNASNIDSLDVVIDLSALKYSELLYADLTNVTPYWWNGSAWIKLSDYTYDPTSRRMTIHIGVNTTPSIMDLGGTPIVLASPYLVVGGEITMEASKAGNDHVVLVPVALAILAVLGAVMIAVRVNRR